MSVGYLQLTGFKKPQEKPQLIRSAVIGGALLFVWSSLSWMVLPWHHQTLKGLNEDQPVIQAMTENTRGSGVYLVPFTNHKKKAENAPPQITKSPFVFMVYNADGYGNMGFRMAAALLGDMMTAFFLAWVISFFNVYGFLPRVLFAALSALFAGLAMHVPNEIWWGHSTAFTLVAVADLVIGWTIAGLAVAKFL